jgi:hypothetical protein
MGAFVHGENISDAWLGGLALLLDGDGEAVNLTVTIDDPTAEESTVRTALDGLIAKRRIKDKKVQPVETVANTIFPQALYVERLGDDAEAHLYEMERRSRAVYRRKNHHDTYFQRMVAWPGRDDEVFNQLEQAITRLRRLREQGKQRGNQFEVGLTSAADEAIALPVVAPGRDRRIIGFPCLSHVSLSLQKGVVHMTALYRNHEFVERAYGNYVGLGRLLRFVTQQSGWPIGELTCISASVSLGSKFSKRSLQGLLSDSGAHAAAPR